MYFLDNIKLTLFAGKGGNGIVAWRREKYIPKGGPYGGDGGNGGSVYLQASGNLFSLEKFRTKKILKAENGQAGGPNNKKGKNGKDLIIQLPVGTFIKDVNTGKILYDLNEDGQKILLLKGGVGGLGNTNFKTSTNQAPNIATDGKKGEEIAIELELKLIADIGFIGFPNAGKSTLLKAITANNIKIAPYPFTTLSPNLAMKEFDDYSRILIADIPGIIKDASKNKGLGFKFLKHIERTKALVFVIDISNIDNRDPIEDFLTLKKELHAYSKDILKKPYIIALNKIDSENADKNMKKFKNHFNFSEEILFVISAKNGLNIDLLLRKIKDLSQKDGKRFI